MVEWWKHARKHQHDTPPAHLPANFWSLTSKVGERLCCDENMTRAWAALAPHFDDIGHVPDSESLAHYCVLTRMHWLLDEHQTQSERRKRLRTLAQQLRKIAKRITGLPEVGAVGAAPARLSPLLMVRRESLERVVTSLKAPVVEGYDVKRDQQTVDEVHATLAGLLPSFLSYTDWVSERLDELSALQPMSARPHRSTAERTFFMRHLVRADAKVTHRAD